MFCCLFSRKRNSDSYETPNEATPFLPLTPTATINYKTSFLLPYEHVLRDDRIIFETSNTYESNATETSFHFSDTPSNESWETASFSFADDNVNPVVLKTTTTAKKTDDGHILVERILQINPAGAVNSSNAIAMRPLNQKKTNSSTVMAARPFDEFLTSSSSNNTDPMQTQDGSSTIK